MALGAILLAVAPSTGFAAASARGFDAGRFNYRIEMTPSALLAADDATFGAFADKVRADLDWLTDTRIISDHSSLRAILSVRLAMEALSGHEDSAALFTLSQIRDLEDKTDARQTAGTELEALLKARQQTGEEWGPDVTHTYQRILRADLEVLPTPIAAQEIKSDKLRAELGSPAALFGLVDASMGASVAQTHSLSALQAWDLISARATLKLILPLREATEAAIAGLATQAPPAADIWAAREVTLTAADRPTPVVVAIWDFGVDLSQFPGQVYTDPAPGPDPHGLAFDKQGQPTHGALLPLTADQAARYPAFVHSMAGFSEMEAGLATAEATALEAKLKSLTPSQFAGELEDLSLYESYAHGTHVAGIAARGNPAVRLAVARMSSDWRTVPDAPTLAQADRDAHDVETTVRWFRDHGVRVVNMSWEERQGLVLTALERAGADRTLQARVALANRIFAVESAALRQAIAAAPGILFVCAAGNDGLDTKTVEGVPASFNLPNLLTVGAVDQAGVETSFTNFGASVKVDADGYQVESNLPGGLSARMSGTSMASPNVANLAAKLIALDPALTPPEVIGLIERAARPSADGRLHTIDPKGSIELLRSRLNAATGVRKREAGAGT